MTVRRNISKPLRAAYYKTLQGITYGGEVVPVADSFLAAENFSNHHIIISSISENDDSPQGSYDDEVVVNIDIVTILFNGYSRDIADSLEDEVLTRLLNGLILPAIDIHCIRKQGSDYLEEQGDNGNIIRKIIRISQRIVQK